MTQDHVNTRRGRGRGSFHALRLARRNMQRRGGSHGKWRSHQAEVRERRMRILMVLTMALGFELAAAALTSPLLGINRVAIRGTDQLPPREAAVTRGAAVVPAGTNLLRAPLGQLAQRMESLPWVQSARVGWISPHALGIRVVPREPTVVAEIGGQRLEVDATGVPIRLARAAEAKALPTVEVERVMKLRLGVPLRDDSLMAAIGIYRDASRQPMVRIAKIKVDSAGNMCLNMTDGIRIELGPPDELAEKMKFVERVYRLDPNVCSRMTAINVSVPKQPACTLKADVSTDLAAPPDSASKPGASASEPGVVL